MEGVATGDDAKSPEGQRAFFFAYFRSSEDGLSSQEVALRQAEHGPNVYGSKRDVHLQQEHHKRVQPYLHAGAMIKRDGAFTLVDTADAVPGDIIQLTTGTVVCADCKLISAAKEKLRLDVSMITGEGERVAVVGYDVFMNSVVLDGDGEAIVVATGDRTFFGRAAQYVDINAQPLTRNETEHLIETIGVVPIQPHHTKLKSCTALILDARYIEACPHAKQRVEELIAHGIKPIFTVEAGEATEKLLAAITSSLGWSIHQHSADQAQHHYEEGVPVAISLSANDVATMGTVELNNALVNNVGAVVSCAQISSENAPSSTRVVLMRSLNSFGNDLGKFLIASVSDMATSEQAYMRMYSSVLIAPSECSLAAKTAAHLMLMKPDALEAIARLVATAHAEGEKYRCILC